MLLTAKQKSSTHNKSQNSYKIKKKVKVFHYKPDVAVGVPGG
jgi:hypothetical protein